MEVISFDGKSKAKICLEQGARLCDLVFQNTQVLAMDKLSDYKDNYASSVLFPFANRVRDGKYEFNGETFSLNCNETEKNNALHGLVYNKTYTVVNEEATSTSASVILRYKDEGANNGFPYKFSIELTYTLSNSGLNLLINIKNTDDKNFPFTLGWHPYFNSENLEVSTLNFNSNKTHSFDEQQIVTGTQSFNTEMPFQLKNVKLDDSFELEDNNVSFNSPGYKLTITSSAKDNFLQLYTPPKPNSIAIEPMTGICDSLNNKIGLQTLQPNQSYSIEWQLAITI